MRYKDISECRVCENQNLIEVINFEEQFLSATFVNSNLDNPLSSIKVPLTVMICDFESCGLVQLKQTTEPNLLYTNYFYRSATNSTMIKDLRTVVDKALERSKIKAGDIVVDIAANDGTLLKNYSNSLVRIGVEPAKNIDWSDLDPEIKIVNEYFNENAITKVLDGNKVKIFTCCAMFYDLDNPNEFVKAVKNTLAKDGIFCIQLSYVLSMINNMNFYDICHEHLEYYSLESLNFLMERHGLTIFDAELNEVNGGSALVFITHVENKMALSENYKKLIKTEQTAKLKNPKVYLDFGKKINELKEKVYKTIKNENKNGGYVVGLGASTKGNVLLQFFGLTKELIPVISEINKSKIGLRTLGSDIPLVSDGEIDKLNPTMKLVLPWYFKNEIINRESNYIENGGKLFFPMPYPHIVSKSGELAI
jgi:hypothetical protein